MIGCKLGGVLEIDDIETYKSFLRPKIRFNSSTPLEPGFPFYREDGALTLTWTGFKYERLSSICFHYGLIDHTIGTCYPNLEGEMSNMDSP